MVQDEDETQEGDARWKGRPKLGQDCWRDEWTSTTTKHPEKCLADAQEEALMTRKSAKPRYHWRVWTPSRVAMPSAGRGLAPYHSFRTLPDLIPSHRTHTKHQDGIGANEGRREYRPSSGLFDASTSSPPTRGYPSTLSGVRERSRFSGFRMCMMTLWLKKYCCSEEGAASLSRRE